MKFTRMHFEWFVDMCIELEFVEFQVDALTKMLHSTNPRFNEHRFRTTLERKRQITQN